MNLILIVAMKGTTPPLHSRHPSPRHPSFRLALLPPFPPPPGTLVLVVSLAETWLWRLTGDDHNRAVVNVVVTLASAAPAAFTASSIAHPRRKFSMVRDG